MAEDFSLRGNSTHLSSNKQQRLVSFNEDLMITHIDSLKLERGFGTFMLPTVYMKCLGRKTKIEIMSFSK